MVFVETIQNENEPLIPNKSKQSVLAITLANSIQRLVNMLDNITEYSMKDLVPLSMLQNHKYISPYLEFLKENKKHIKRKHAKEVLHAIEKISFMIKIGDYPNDKNKQRFYNRS